jgi:hypothetical protein
MASVSRLNAVEGFFAKLAKRRLRRDAFGSLVEVQPSSSAPSLKATGTRSFSSGLATRIDSFKPQSAGTK